MPRRFLIVMVFTFGCRGHISNSYDEFKLVCGADVVRDDRPVVAFRLENAPLSERVAVTGVFLEAENSRAFESRTGCLSVDEGFQGIIMARTLRGEQVSSLPIGIEAPLKNLTVSYLHPNPMTTDLWDQCGDRGFQLSDGILFKLIRGRRVAFHPGDVTITRKKDKGTLPYSERGCFWVTEADLREGVSVSTPDGANRSMNLDTLPSLAAKGINNLLICEKNQYWDLASNSCQGSNPLALTDFFSAPAYKKTAESMMMSGCVVDTDQGIRDCPTPSTFSQLDQLYFLLQEFSIAVLNDARMQNFPNEKNILSRSTSLALQRMEKTSVYQKAAADENALMLPIASRTGMKVIATITLPFSLRYNSLRNLQQFIDAEQDLLLLKSLKFLTIVVSDVNTYDSSGRIIFFNARGTLADIRQHVQFVKSLNISP